ncbi:MAG TPA: ABC transporter substrate-binding protein [Stellaceae bacterium]|jgi:peptide/nickel transport system substrate-binding protein|nr:ABC transporter substrate-binding protein [Stellaceae bacterium]
MCWRLRVAARLAAATLLALFIVLPAAADETPKRGGTLTYMIPADAPPSFDAQREETYATIHAAAPFYSVLIRANPMDPASPDMVCDLCTEMPKPTENATVYTFKIRQGVKFHDGTPLTADDIVASWKKIIFPPPGVVSPRQSNFMMVDKIEAPDPFTVVFRLKFATDAFIPALADPYAWIYSKAKLDQDIHWYEKNILGSGPFKFVSYETGQSISGVRNPDYYHPGLPYLDGFKGIFADKQVTRVEAIRSDRAAIEFRGFPPTVRDELKQALGDKIAVQTSDWNCGGLITPNHKRKPFDDPRVRRALTLALDRWGTAPELSKIAIVHTVGGVTFPGSSLAATKEDLQKIAGYWPDIEKSRAEARRLLKEAGAENLSFELLNRSTDQPYKYYGIWALDDWSKIGLHVTQRVLPTGPWFQAMRDENFDVTVEGNCQNIVNPLADIGKYLPHTVSPSNYGNFEDEEEVQIYNQLLRELDKKKQYDLLRKFEKRVLDEQAHGIFLLWWQRIVPYRSYVKGWKIGPSHYVNQDLGTVWLDK